MPTNNKKDTLIIDAENIKKVMVKVTFGMDVEGNLDGAMSKITSILDKIAAQAEIEDDAIEMKLEAKI